jgi:hypothetical protein
MAASQPFSKGNKNNKWYYKVKAHEEEGDVFYPNNLGSIVSKLQKNMLFYHIKIAASRPSLILYENHW